MAATRAGRVASNVALGMFCAWSAACGVSASEPPSRAETPASLSQAIAGGRPAPDDHQVFSLKVTGSNGRSLNCSAVLIAGRTLLTAAHCVDPVMLQAESVTVLAHHRARDGLVSEQDWLPVTQLRMHPQFNPYQLQATADLALLLLPTEPLVSPKPWNTESVEHLSGQTLRALGYGGTGLIGGTGVRRGVDVLLRQFRPGLLIIGDQGLSPETGHGICPGDSGGPSLYTFPDGEERVVGIHSYTVSPTCTDGADTRVDSYADFIFEWLWTVETSVCAPDGQCGSECPDARVDPDCEEVPPCTGDKCVGSEHASGLSHDVPTVDGAMPVRRGCQTVPGFSLAALAWLVWRRRGSTPAL